MVVSSAIEVAGCDRAAIYLRQGADGLVLTEAQGFPADLTGKAQAELLPLTPEQRCAVLDNGETVLVSDLEQEQDNLGTGALRLAGEGGFSAFACLPLTTPNGRIGLLTVFYDQPHTFAGSELELLETFANQAALAVTNAQDTRIGAQLTRRSSQIGGWPTSASGSAPLDLGTICGWCWMPRWRAAAYPPGYWYWSARMSRASRNRAADGGLAWLDPAAPTARRTTSPRS